MEERYLKYIEHQKIKTLDPKRREKWLNEEWEQKITEFNEGFNDLKDCENALCVCARTGQEVQALRDKGIDAIGIDIVPCEPLVVEGDMHDIPFPDNHFDLVYSNSFDHCLYPEKFIQEIERVSRKYILLHLQIGKFQDEFTATRIDSSKEVIDMFKSSSILKDQAVKLSMPYNWEILAKC